MRQSGAAPDTQKPLQHRCRRPTCKATRMQLSCSLLNHGRKPAIGCHPATHSENVLQGGAWITKPRRFSGAAWSPSRNLVLVLEFSLCIMWRPLNHTFYREAQRVNRNPPLERCARRRAVDCRVFNRHLALPIAFAGALHTIPKAVSGSAAGFAGPELRTAAQPTSPAGLRKSSYAFAFSLPGPRSGIGQPSVIPVTALPVMQGNFGRIHPTACNRLACEQRRELRVAFWIGLRGGASARILASAHTLAR